MILCIIPEAVAHFYQYTGLMASHLLILPWCMAIAGYRTSSNNINTASSNQLLDTDEQATHYQTLVHQREWKPPQTQYVQQFQYDTVIAACASLSVGCFYCWCHSFWLLLDEPNCFSNVQSLFWLQNVTEVGLLLDTISRMLHRL